MTISNSSGTDPINRQADLSNQFDFSSTDQWPVTYRGTVYPWHCDHVGHMNVMWYVGKFDEASWQFFHLLGLTPQYLRENKRGMAAVDQHLSYLRELHAGDVLTVRSELLEFKKKSLRFVHEMRLNGEVEVVARCTIKAVHIDSEQRKSCEFPDQFERMARILFDRVA
ncbi:thioesterase family protein [Paraburkholderia sp. SIMBA_049]